MQARSSLHRSERRELVDIRPVRRGGGQFGGGGQFRRRCFGGGIQVTSVREVGCGFTRPVQGTTPRYATYSQQPLPKPLTRPSMPQYRWLPPRQADLWRTAQRTAGRRRHQDEVPQVFRRSETCHFKEGARRCHRSAHAEEVGDYYRTFVVRNP